MSNFSSHDIALLDSLFPSAPTMSGGSTANPAILGTPIGPTNPDGTSAAGLYENPANPPNASGFGNITVNVPGIQQVGNAVQGAQNWITQNASSFFLRGGIEAIGVLFLAIGLIMLMNRSSAEAAAQTIAETIGK